MAPLTAEELLRHPEYPYTIWDLKPAHKGKAVVAKDRGGPFNIAYEIHGHGDRHLVVSGSTFHITVNLQHDALHIRQQGKLGVWPGCICNVAALTPPIRPASVTVSFQSH